MKLDGIDWQNPYEGKTEAFNSIIEHILFEDKKPESAIAIK